MKKLALGLAFLIGSVASASAACVGPVVMHDFPGTSFNMSVVTAPTGANDCQSNVAIPTWAGGTLGAMANYGTSPGAVLVPGVNAFVTNTTPLGQAVMASSSPVVIASNQSAVPVTLTSTTITGTVAATQSGTWTVQPGNTANTTAWLVRPNDGTRSAIVDPCEANLQTYAPISITTATTTRIVAPSASNKTYICMLFLTSAAADNIGIVEGTGGTCGTGTAGVIGGTTAANGPNFAANGGMLIQAGGKVAAAYTAGTNVDLCLITSAATPLAGGIKYVQAP
jgi:hypothetical protein